MRDDVIIQPFGTTATPISMTATEMDILSSRAFSVAEVSRFLGVPKVLLGDGSNSTYKTPDAALQEFYKFTMQPKVREYEDEANYKILSEYDWGKRQIHLCERDLMRLDPMAQAQLTEKLLGLGIKTINEARKDYDQPAIAGGDKAYVTVQAQPLGDIKEEGGEE
jgi:HK97 family phage portal protein